MICRDPSARALIFPRADGDPWTDTDYRNWRKRIFKPAVAKAGIDLGRPYDLRHAFVSLLFAEGRSVVYVAAQAGHAPTMTLDTYAHVIAELEGDERRSADELIAIARGADLLFSFPGRPKRLRRRTRHVQRLQVKAGKPSNGLEP